MVNSKKKQKNRKNKGRKMPVEAKVIIAGIGVIALLLTGIIILSMVDLDKKEKKIEEPDKFAHLYIDEVRFVNNDASTRADDEEQTVKAKVFFTNDGKATSKNVKVEVFAVVEENNMAEDEATVEVGDIEPMKTQTAEFELDLPRGSGYRIDLLVFEDGMITKKGHGTVKIEKSAEMKAEVFQTTHENNMYGDDDEGPGEDGKACDEEDGSAAIGGLITMIVIIAVIIVIIAALWATKKKNINKPLRPVIKEEKQVVRPLPAPPIDYFKK